MTDSSGAIGTRLVVTGTDTGIGKTVLSALMTLVLDGEYWKPVQAGTEPETDSDTIRQITGLAKDRIHPETYRLKTPASPDQAAAREGIRIDVQTIVPPVTKRPLIIEGAGGILVPLNEATSFLDLFDAWKFPVLIAARSTLGTLNHTLLTVQALRQRNVPIVGIVMSGHEHPENVQSLEQHGGIPVVGRIPVLETLSAETLMDAYQHFFQPVEKWLYRHESKPVDML